MADPDLDGVFLFQLPVFVVVAFAVSVLFVCLISLTECLKPNFSSNTCYKDIVYS